MYQILESKKSIIIWQFRVFSKNVFPPNKCWLLLILSHTIKTLYAVQSARADESADHILSRGSRPDGQTWWHQSCHTWCIEPDWNHSAHKHLNLTHLPPIMHTLNSQARWRRSGAWREIPTSTRPRSNNSRHDSYAILAIIEPDHILHTNTVATQ